MSDPTENIDLNNLSPGELKKLLSKTRRALNSANKREKSKPKVSVDDHEIRGIADLIRKTARKKKVSTPDFVDTLLRSMKMRNKIARKSPKSGAKASAQYRHPEDASKTWSGFGRRPEWLIEALNSGVKLEELKIKG